MAAVLTYPETTIIGATDIYKMVTFLSVFGAQPERLPNLTREAASALYGIDSELRHFVLHEPGGTETIRVIETPHEAPPFTPLVAGPYGIDYYSRDLELSIGMLKAAGATDFSPLVGYAGEPSIHGEDTSGKKTHELLLHGPDNLGIFLTDITITSAPWPTKLTTEPHRLHSEVLMLCWIISDKKGERRFWSEEVGMEIVGDGFPENDEMQKLMYHPRSTPLHCLNITDAGHHHKMELMSYPDETVGRRPDWPLLAGFHAGGFFVDNLEETTEALPSATFGDIVTVDAGSGPQRARTAASPDGVRFELWERHSN
jgi:hypothetical protein